MWRKVQFKVWICLKLVPQILDPGLSSKVAVRTRIVQVDRLHVDRHQDWTFQNNPQQLGGSMHWNGLGFFAHAPGTN
jgi:hypothetical protein